MQIEGREGKGLREGAYCWCTVGTEEKDVISHERPGSGIVQVSSVTQSCLSDGTDLNYP